MSSRESKSSQLLALDRIIQLIQPYARVFSPRLHPLLCALTSAEQVAYAEQPHPKNGELAGKFRSLLMDIFGIHLPEKQWFRVDRAKVAAYKDNVR